MGAKKKYIYIEKSEKEKKKRKAGDEGKKRSAKGEEKRGKEVPIKLISTALGR